MSDGLFTRIIFGLAVVVAAGTMILNCTPEGEVQPVQFEVIDSLLGDTVMIPAADLSFRIPARFARVSDTLSFDESLDGPPMYIEAWPRETTATFAHSRGGSLTIVSIDSLGLTGDTGQFMADLRERLANDYGDRHLTWGDYSVGGLYVKNLLVTDSTHVQFYLLLFGPTTTTVQLRYFVPKSEYSELLKPLESSIGSAHILSSPDSTVY